MIGEHTRKLIGYLNRKIDAEWKVWQLLDRDMARGISMSSIIRQALIKHYADRVDPKDYHTVATLADMAQKLADENAALRDENDQLTVDLNWSEQRATELQETIDTLIQQNRQLGAALKVVLDDPTQIGKLREQFKKKTS